MLKKALIIIMAILLLMGVGLQAMAAPFQANTLKAPQIASNGITPASLPSISHLPLVNRTLNAIRSASGHTVNNARLQLAKTTSVKSINSIINALNMVNSRVALSKLSNTDKATVMSQISSNITWFEAEKNAIQSSNDSASIRMDISQVTGQWNSIKTGLKQETGILACDEFDSRLSNASRASSIASQKIQSLNARGKDTSDLQEALTSYNSHLASATTYSQNARADFNNINSPSTADASYSAGLKQLNLGQQQLSASYQDLVSMYRLLLGNNVTINSPSP